MKGTVYGVGVGPGDPELITLKAVRIIRENEIIALPGKDPTETVAYNIALQAVPELADKTLLPVYMPMTMDLDTQRTNHRKGADKIEEYLKKGINVVYLTLGDPTVYSTFSYLQEIIEADGYKTALVSGVTSFCAAAARLNIPIVEWNEPMHVIPAVHKLDYPFNMPGNFVLMKSGRHMDKVKKILSTINKDIKMVTDCGMATEQVYECTEEIPDNAGYFSLIIAKDK